jgi:hypothetical protein
MAKITLSVPDDLYGKIEKHKDEINISEFFRHCVSKEIERLDSFARPPGFSWRTINYEDGIITVDAKFDEFGPKDWTLEIKSPKLEEPLILKIDGMPRLDQIITGISDYYNHKALKVKGVNLAQDVHKDALSELWIAIAKWARRNDIELSTNVALLPFESIRVHGKHGLSDFDGEVTPKKWEDVHKDEDHINVFFSNFWIGSYMHTKGTVFRLSSYLTENMGVLSAKAATRYIDLNPDEQRDKEEINKLIAKATVVYLPDLSIKNVRSLFYRDSDR